jgi:hypothetical protein
MASTPKKSTPISIEQQWECRLSASPDRVEKDNAVTFTVTLSHPQIGAIDSIPSITSECICDFYNLFTYSYDSHDPRLTILTDRQPANEPKNEAVVQSLPRLPDGDYTIDVTVTIDDNGAAVTRWFSDATDAMLRGLGIDRETWVHLGHHLVHGTTSGHSLSDSKPLHVVAHFIETDSKVTLQRTFAGPTDDRALWPAIRNRTAAIGFDRYKAFIDCVFCDNDRKQQDPFTDVRKKILPRYLDNCPEEPAKPLSIYGPYAYSVLKLATQVFLTLESGVVIRHNTAGKPKIFDIEKERIRVGDFSLTVERLKHELQAYLAPHDHLPYLDRIVKNFITLDGRNIEPVLPYCLGVLEFRLTSPSLIELIWSYWLEEGMLVQTMNAIARRFQNRRGSANDPLGELEFDPLRPLNNLIWGFIQDEHNRLTVPRRAHEYEHHYGLSLMGKAVPDLNPADSRSKFIEGFHNLLSAAARFFKEDSDTTVFADAFPLLNALKDVHLLLAEGAHNQFGDLTWTARAEMLTIQWMLARPEMKEFLRGRYMVPYQEEWMGAVDSMKKLQGWTDTTITHFYELAVTGERILLSIRYGDWSDIENIEDQAKNWARSCKPEIQRYIYAYQTVAGVDLSADIVDSRDAATRYLQPSALLQRRLTQQMSAMPRRPSNGPDLVAARVSGQAALPRPGRPKLPVYRKES